MGRIHARYVRYREFDRLRHSQYFLAFLQAIADKFAAGNVVDSQTATFDNTTNTVTITDTTGYNAEPVQFSTDGTLPAEITAGTTYWANVTGATTLTLHPTEQDAIDGSNTVAFTDDGTGTHTVERLAADPGNLTAEGIFALMKEDGYTAEQLRGLDSWPV